MILFSLY